MKIHRVKLKAVPAAKPEAGRRAAKKAASGRPGGAGATGGKRAPLHAISPPPARAAGPLPPLELDEAIPVLEPGAADARQRLVQFGATEEFADRIVARVLESGARGAYAIDAAARIIGQSVPVLRSPKVSGAPHVITFVGPTGAGKTSTLAKLGRRLVEAGRRVLFASLDPVGAGALERVGSVGTDVDRTEIPLVALHNGKELLRAVRRHYSSDVVLVDTPGLSPRGEAELDSLGREVQGTGRELVNDVYLVLPASASRSALNLACRAFARTRPVATVITKLDESSEPATAIEQSVRMRLPLAFLCDGQDVRLHLWRPTADRLADLMLRGRIA